MKKLRRKSVLNVLKEESFNDVVKAYTESFESKNVKFFNGNAE